MHRSLAGVALVVGVLGGHAVPAADGGFERSVVRIVNYSQRGDWYTPWDVTAVRASSGSGFVLEDGLVLTNAHVVSDARLLVLYLHGDPNPHEARVRVLGHDADLALVVPVEEGLLSGLAPLELGGLPALRSTVETYGYPAGGDQISSTRGVVSRIEMQTYTHSDVDRHLTIQTDAAINPGNSGGPVMQDGRVVGVAFQGADNLENVGLFIPVEVIGHFLEDVKDGKYDGYPDLGIRSATLENPAARRRAGMEEGESGVLVDFVAREGSADGHLEVGDVLLSVEGHDIANDGSALVDGLRLHYGVLVDRLQMGETVEARVLRGGERVDLAFPLESFPGAERHANVYDRLPRYYVYGGLVFVPLDVEMLKTMGRDWLSSADKRLVYEHLLRVLEDPGAGLVERVVLLRRLDHPVNVNVAWYRNQLLERVNGRKITSLAGLIEAIETNAAPWHVFEFEDSGRFAVLEREAADRAHPEILRQYGVPRDRNP